MPAPEEQGLRPTPTTTIDDYGKIRPPKTPPSFDPSEGI